MRQSCLRIALLLVAAAGPIFAEPTRAGEVRSWTSANGQFTVQAELVEYSEGKLHLRRADGKTLVVPLRQISQEDQAHLRSLIRNDALPSGEVARSGNQASDAVPSDRKPSSERPRSPENVARQFVGAMILGEEETIRQLALPDDRLAELWRNSFSVSEEMRSDFRKHIRELRVARLRVGDKFTLSGRGTQLVGPEDVNDNRIMLNVGAEADPIVVVNAEGEWRVDASMQIESRAKRNAAVESALSVHSPSIAEAAPFGRKATTPEDVAREFLLALRFMDHDMIRHYALPDERLSMLWGASAMRRRGLIRALAGDARGEMRRLNVGDKIRGPNGVGEATISTAMVNDARLMLQAGDNPFPVSLVKYDGHWRVDPQPYISAILTGDHTAAGSGANTSLNDMNGPADNSSPMQEDDHDRLRKLSPEESVREFTIAVIMEDADAIRQLVLPHKDMAFLWTSGEALAPQAQAEMVNQIRSLAVRRLKIGEKVDVPGVGLIVMDEDRINQRRQQVTFPGNPIPFDVHLMPQGWRIDATPVITFMKFKATGAP